MEGEAGAQEGGEGGNRAPDSVHGPGMSERKRPEAEQLWVPAHVFSHLFHMDFDVSRTKVSFREKRQMLQ